MKEKVRYWIDLADYDLETARVMLEGKRFLYVGFMCHQVIEKALKAYYASVKEDSPPFTHNLNYLDNQSGIYEQMAEELRSTIDIIEPLNVEARYPTHKEKLLKALSYERCKDIVEKTEELYRWIKKQLSNG